MAGPAEHFQTKWGQAYAIDITRPPAKTRWEQIPTVPICSVGPVMT